MRLPSVSLARWRRPVVTAVALVVVTVGGAAAEGRKLALLIGNKDYSALPADVQLQTPINDVNAVAAKLKELGFETTVLTDQTRRDFLDSVHTFAGKVTRDDVAIFYYAGHGVNLGGGNYFLPSDIPAPRGEGKSEEARMADNAISEAQIVDTIGEAQPKTFVAIFDACRDNPLKAEGNKRSLGNTRGLRIEPPPAGMAALYSAGSGQQALDRLPDETASPTQNSVFARALIEHISAKGQSLDDLHRAILREVSDKAKSAGHEQFPGYYSQLFDRFYFVPPDAAVPAVQQTVAQGGQQPVGQDVAAAGQGQDAAPTIAAQPTGQGQTPAPSANQAAAASTNFSLGGLTLVALDSAARQKHGLSDRVAGLVVDAVSPGSEGAGRDIEVGDVVVQLGDQTASTLAAATEQLASLKGAGQKRALVLMTRPTGVQYFTSLTIN